MLSKPVSDILNDSLEYLQTNNLVHFVEERMELQPLGRAAVRCLMSPEAAIAEYTTLNAELLNGLILGEDCHLLYIVTRSPNFFPPLACTSRLMKSLTSGQRALASRLGITEEYLMAKENGLKSSTDMDRRYQRFFVSLALGRLVLEAPLADVARRFGTSLGDLQTLQTNSASAAHQMVNFCQELGLTHLEVLLKDLVSRLTHGVRTELLELTQIKGVKQARARALWNAGYCSVRAIASASERTLAERVPLGKFPLQVAVRIKNEAIKLLHQQARELREEADSLLVPSD